MADFWYSQNSAVTRLHNVPRFGHGKRSASLVSDSIEQKDSYKTGIISFTIFLACMVFVWSMILLVLKYYYGQTRVGCAARGIPVDPSELRKQGVSRRERRKRIHRAWRIQNVFLLLSATIPCITCLLVNHGYRPFIRSLQDVVDANDDVESRALEGLGIVNTISMASMEVVSKHMVNPEIFDISSTCQNFENASEAIKALDNEFDEFRQRFTVGLEHVEGFLGGSMVDLSKGLEDISSATESIDDAVQHIHNNDWYFKLFLLLLNVFNLLLWIGAFLTKCGVDFQGYHRVMAWFVLPSFGLLLLALICATGIMSTLSLLTADFCAGGEAPGSPQGTLIDIAQVLGYKSDGITFQSLEYYLKGCSTENPLAFVGEFRLEVEEAGTSASVLGDALRSIENATLTEACGENFPELLSTVEDVGSSFRSISGYLGAAIRVTDCARVFPILDEIFHGATCGTTMEGLSGMFGGLLGLTFVVMIMFSTRAALFNPVYKAKKRLRREREFDEYREFMAQFYEDAGEWKIDPDMKSLLKIDYSYTDSNSQTDSAHSGDKKNPTTTDTDFDQDSIFHTSSHLTFSEQVVMTPLTKAAVAAGAKAAAQAAERAMLEPALEGNEDDDCESCESSVDSGDEHSIMSNISSIVDRFFRRRMESTDLSIASSFAPSASSAPPAQATTNQSFDLLGDMGRSYDSDSDVDCYLDDSVDEPPTPQIDRSFAPRPAAPQKIVKSLGRTQGGSYLDM